MRLLRVDPDGHAEAATVHRLRRPRRTSQSFERSGRDDRSPRTLAAVVAVPLALRPRHPYGLPGEFGQRLGPRAFDDPPDDGAAEEVRLDAVTELPGLSIHDRVVREAEDEPPVLDCRPHREERGQALRIDERTLIVDEVEAPVTPDARRLEFDLVHRL